MNLSDTFYIPLLPVICLAAGFIFHAVRCTGWRRAAGWLAVLTGMVWGGSVFIAWHPATSSQLLQIIAVLLPICVLMIPLLGMLVLAWRTGVQLAGGLTQLGRRFTK